MEHEEAVVRAFILPQRRERFLEYLAKPQRRKKLTSQLGHFNALDPRYTVRIQPSQQHPKPIAQLLRSLGAGPNCWVISEDSRLDGKEMDLDTALKETVGYGMGTFLSCIPGKLAYFEDEDVRYILRR